MHTSIGKSVIIWSPRRIHLQHTLCLAIDVTPVFTSTSSGPQLTSIFACQKDAECHLVLRWPWTVPNPSWNESLEVFRAGTLRQRDFSQEQSLKGKWRNLPFSLGSITRHNQRTFKGHVVGSKQDRHCWYHSTYVEHSEITRIWTRETWNLWTGPGVSKILCVQGQRVKMMALLYNYAKIPVVTTQLRKWRARLCSNKTLFVHTEGLISYNVLMCHEIALFLFIFS